MVASRVLYLQQPAVGRADVSEGLVVDGGDEQRGEQRVSHLPVEQIHSVTRLGHQSGLISAAHIILHALLSHTHTHWSIRHFILNIYTSYFAYRRLSKV